MYSRSKEMEPVVDSTHRRVKVARWLQWNKGQESICWKVLIFSPFWSLKLSTGHLGFYFAKGIVHAHLALELRIVVVAGWCRFDTSNLWRIIQQNKWKNKAEWGILSNGSQVGLGTLRVCRLSNLFQLQALCLTSSLGKVHIFQK